MRQRAPHSSDALETMPRHSPERPTDGAHVSSGSVLDLELEDEKENDRHRRRTQQSRDDPGAKACEAMCVLCVGLLFVQVAFIVYSNGLDGTIRLLMAPEQPLRQGPRVHSYRVSGPTPDGYSDAVTVAYNAAKGVQVVHFTVQGASATLPSSTRAVRCVPARHLPAHNLTTLPVSPAPRHAAGGGSGRTGPHDHVAGVHCPRGSHPSLLPAACQRLFPGLRGASAP